jgi:hypothetical protein
MSYRIAKEIFAGLGGHGSIKARLNGHGKSSTPWGSECGDTTARRGCGPSKTLARVGQSRAAAPEQNAGQERYGERM